MKTLVESILDSQEQVIQDAEKKAEKAATFNKFKKDVMDILSQQGLKIVDSGKYTKENPFVVRRTISSHHDWRFGAYDGIVEEYDIHCSWENDVTDRYGFASGDNGFRLTLYIWNDTELGRPRYSFGDFKLCLPATRMGGYGLDNIHKKFGAKKLTPEYYDMGIKHILSVVRAFVKNTRVMHTMWSKCTDRNPQTADFRKVANTIFGDLLKDDN